MILFEQHCEPNPNAEDPQHWAGRLLAGICEIERILSLQQFDIVVS